MGVWIETEDSRQEQLAYQVTPCVGVWIETSAGDILLHELKGHTLRGCVD